MNQFENSVQAFDADGNSLGVVFATTSPFDTPRAMAEIVTQTADRLLAPTVKDRLWLCALCFAGKHYRRKQRGLLSGAASDTGDAIH
jgi:hypothetical protein